MYELLEEDEKELLEQYYVTKNVLTKIATFFSNCNFIKSYNDFLSLCEIACSRYQSDRVYNDYLHSLGGQGYIISIEEVLCDSLKEFYEEPEDMNNEDKKELEIFQIKLLQQKKRHI